MRIRGYQAKLALGLLLLIVCYGAYRIGAHLQAQRHHDAALQALERRDFRDAGFHLNECLRAWPSDPAVHLLAAQTARRRGDFNDAERKLRAYGRLNGPMERAALEYRLLIFHQGNIADSEKLFELVRREAHGPATYLILEAVIGENIKLLEQASNSGMTLIEGPAGQARASTETAISLWRQLRTGKADQACGLVWLGRIQRLISQQEAASTFQQALEVDPNHFEARLYLALALADDHVRETVRNLEILRRSHPQNHEVGVLLGSYYRSLGMFDEARGILDEILAAEPDRLAAVVERGKLALDAGCLEEAEPYLRRGVALAPADAFNHLALSRCLHLAGKSEEAQQHQERYSEIESARTKTARLRAEEERTAWRHRLAQEALQKNASGGDR